MTHTYSELMPCLPGEAISKEPLIRPLLSQLKSLVSAPPDIYQQLYLATFAAFAEFCQAMPFDIQQPEPYSLLQRQLELAITALKLRRGRMLPQNSESESIAEQEPLWTYAVFTACLFTGLARLQKDRTVALYVNANEKIGQWSVLTGNLYEQKTHYSVSTKPNRKLVDSSGYMAFLAGRIVPSCAIRWLTGYSEVFISWWQAITSDIQAEKVDGLTLLIKQAAEKINYPLNPEETMEAEKLIILSSSNKRILEDMTSWLQQQCEENGCDPERDLLLRIPDGLFIASKRIADFLMCYPNYGSQDDLLQNLKDHLLKENDSIIHRYRFAHFEKRLILEGIILNEVDLPPAVKILPYQSSFVSEIPLS